MPETDTPNKTSVDLAGVAEKEADSATRKLLTWLFIVWVSSHLIVDVIMDVAWFYTKMRGL